MASANEEGARRAARDVLAELGISNYPVEPAVIANAKQLPVEYNDGFPEGVYGALWRSGNAFGIIVSNECPTAGHRRFTLAHELGHYHLDGHVEQLFRGGDGLAPSLAGHFRGRKDPIEVEADAFAGELLVPTPFARSLLDGPSVGMRGVLRLRDAFDVSLSCAAIRYAQLADEPLVVVLSKDGVVEWTARSEALWAQGGWARRPWKQEWVPRRSGTRRLAGDAARRRTGADDSSELLACEWCEGAPPSAVAVEEAIGLGIFDRILTILRFPDLPDPDTAYLLAEREEREAREARDGSGRRGDWRTGLRTYGFDSTDD
ncbi:MAG: ImmA/IrrE family metallo-endopeptidase [Gemmatimonas sp.]